MKKTFISDFFKLESSGGIILMLAAALALLLANSPLRLYYNYLWDIPVNIQIGTLIIAKPLLLWVNDGLMAVFFFMIGLELKRELVEGELSDRRSIMLPGISAIGGMLVPALIYVIFNFKDPIALQGWAIPAATDIAFALGILSLMGSKVPTSVKLFLTSIAIFDDLGAILIIAIFYTAKISLVALLVAASCLPVLFFLNKRGVGSKSIFLLIGIVMWVAMLKSGIHATLTGVIVSMFVPLRSKHEPGISPLKDLEHDLHPIVAYFVLPVFAFANAGINFKNIGLEQLFHPVPIGIALGLFLGKQLGILGMSWLSIKLKLTSLPSGLTWTSLYGTAILCGVGFTMSLFIGSLAFEETGINLFFDERLGIILGSLLSGITGYLVLGASLNSIKKRMNP